MAEEQTPATVVAAKPAWQSKTILLNVLVGVAGILSTLGLVPGVSVWLQAHTDLVLTGLGAVGVALRMITKGKIGIE